MQEEIKPDFIPQAVLDFFESVGVVITKAQFNSLLKKAIKKIKLS